MQLVRLICRKPVTLQVNNKLHNICTININYTVNAKVLINIHYFHLNDSQKKNDTGLKQYTYEKMYL